MGGESRRQGLRKEELVEGMKQHERLIKENHKTAEDSLTELKDSKDPGTFQDKPEDATKDAKRPPEAFGSEEFELVRLWEAESECQAVPASKSSHASCEGPSKTEKNGKEADSMLSDWDLVETNPSGSESDKKNEPASKPYARVKAPKLSKPKKGRRYRYLNDECETDPDFMLILNAVCLLAYMLLAWPLLYAAWGHMQTFESVDHSIAGSVTPPGPDPSVTFLGDGDVPSVYYVGEGTLVTRSSNDWYRVAQYRNVAPSLEEATRVLADACLREGRACVGFHLQPREDSGRYLEGALLFDAELHDGQFPPDLGFEVSWASKWTGSGRPSLDRASAEVGKGWDTWMAFAMIYPSDQQHWDTCRNE